jgi:threonine dehydratase
VSTIEPSLKRVRAALSAGHPALARTPLLRSHVLSERLQREVFLKAEHLQRTGSFKARGALHRVRSLDETHRARGVVTVSAGNHAAALAWAAALHDVPATVVMPETAPRSKVEACRRYGARIVLEPDVFEALDRCLALRDAEGLTLVHPFDDLEILEGTGTVALEVLEDCPGVAQVVVPVGGGGLIGGMAATLAQVAPDVRVVGVEPEGADAMSRSLTAGRPVRLEAVETVADGLGAPMAGERTYPLVRDHVDTILRLDDDQILAGLAFLAREERQLVEPAGAAAVAALLTGRGPSGTGATSGSGAPGAGPIVAVLSGGNLDLDTLPALLERVR